MGDSFENLTTSANGVGYAVAFATNARESFLQKVKGKEKLVQTHWKVTKHMPCKYFHHISPNVNNGADRYTGNVLFSAPYRLAKMCFMFEKKKKPGLGAPRNMHPLQ